jgi:adenylate cyclase
VAGTEIERKFLLEALPEGVAWTSERRIRQGYLALDGATEVRVRLLDDGGAARLTVKHGSGLVRVEEDLPLDPEAGERLWVLTEGRRVEKVRRTCDLGGGAVAEVDVFGGALEGLLVVEVEHPDTEAAAAFVPPAWFGREVTGEPGFANRALACDGRPPAAGG